MTKKARRVFVGQILDKQDAAKTYNEVNEGMIYNNQDIGIRVQTEGADREFVTDTQTQTLTNKTLTSPTVNSPSINSPTVSNGTFSTPTINTPSINSPTLSGGTLTSSTLNSPSINNVTLSNGNISLVTIESSSLNSTTLSGCTLDLDSNTLNNIEVDNFKSGVVLTSLTSSATNNVLISGKGIFDFVNDGVSTNLSNHISDTIDAHDASAISSVASGNLSATDVQSGLNELQSDIDNRALDNAVVHLTGNESIAGIKTFSDTTDSSTKDNGAIIIEGGVGIEKNVNIGGDLVVTGGLQVNGTTTFVNTTNMEVKDANIIVNKGGNKAAADAGDAGITVEITDGVNANFGYDSSYISKFGCGQVGSISEVITATHSQTLTNKTIDGDNNTIQDVGISSLKTVLADANKIIQYDGSGVPTASKTITGSTIVTPARIDVKQDTAANLTTYAGSAANGQLAFSTDTKTYYGVKDSALVALGGVSVSAESVTYTGYTSKTGANLVLFKTKDTTRSNESTLISVSTASSYTKYTVNSACYGIVTARVDVGSAGTNNMKIYHYDSGNNLIKTGGNFTTTNWQISASIAGKFASGDYFMVESSAASVDSSVTWFSIVAINIS